MLVCKAKFVEIDNGKQWSNLNHQENGIRNENKHQHHSKYTKFQITVQL